MESVYLRHEGEYQSMRVIWLTKHFDWLQYGDWQNSNHFPVESNLCKIQNKNNGAVWIFLSV